MAHLFEQVAGLEELFLRLPKVDSIIVNPFFFCTSVHKNGIIYPVPLSLCIILWHTISLMPLCFCVMDLAFLNFQKVHHLVCEMSIPLKNRIVIIGNKR
jgi:hypothetical protein